MNNSKNLFVFDIETVVDIQSSRNLLSINENIDDQEVRKMISQYHLKITDGKNDFLRQPFHQIVAISFLEAEIIKEGNYEHYILKEIRSGGDLLNSEFDLVKGFFSHLKKHQSRLVSFNGKNFDLPVLKYRAMKHNIEAAWLHKSGDKWNNYQQKYSLDWHCDLADAFSDFGASARVKMNELCAVFGLPGKIDVDGSAVEDLFIANKIGDIRDYCETDVLNTYMLYLIFQHHNGSITTSTFNECKKQIIDFLNKNSNKNHWKKFLEAIKK